MTSPIRLVGHHCAKEPSVKYTILQGMSVKVFYKIKGRVIHTTLYNKITVVTLKASFSNIGGVAEMANTSNTLR